MYDNSDVFLEALVMEGRICSILCRNPEKYLNHLPLPLEEEDFTREECRTIFRTIHQFYKEGEEYNPLALIGYFQRLEDRSYLPEINVITKAADEEQLTDAIKAVRLYSLPRRIRYDAFPNPVAKAEALRELEALRAEKQAALLQRMKEEDERDKQYRKVLLRQTAMKCAPEDHPLLPVLRKAVQLLLEGSHSNPFWSYAEFRELCSQELGYDPVQHSRELRSLLNKNFLEYMYKWEQICVILGYRICGARGIYIIPAPRKRDVRTAPAEKTGTSVYSSPNTNDPLSFDADTICAEDVR